MTDREKLVIAIERAKEQSEEYGLDRILVDFKAVAMILELLKEQEDLGTELTNAVELIHKKNEQIEKLLKEQDAEVEWCARCGRVRLKSK